ncbi:creatinine amidohydrolase [Faunimonas pinastri]|uniref:Creatinine amidohydrolase n=1 Tax=Faunimonas pinastri TaxID=1855383 RepID=A0A1H9E9H4_9HYPH|nr:creatininase family protein [Faunimonas pinastri]SEQ21903.1 creatinine amidohydrolase [Faunimonas pinastri]
MTTPAFPRTLLWQDLTSDELAAARDAGAMVVVPVGAIEQHAAHLPVETDARLATMVTRMAARRVSALPVIVAPTLPFGFSPHHLSHPGTISFGLETYLAALGDIAKSIANSGFRRIVLVNGHGGNNAPLRSKVGQLVTDGYPVATVEYWVPGESRWIPKLLGALKRGGHACEQETALMMVLADNEAEKRRIAEAAKDMKPRVIQPWIAPGYAEDPITEAGAAWPPIFQADDGGYYGDPAAATAETGEVILEIIVERLARFLTGFAAAPLRLGVSRDPARPLISEPLISGTAGASS